MDNFFQKKGQATIFIIIGIIILLTIAVLYYFITQTTEAKLGIALQQDSAHGDAVAVQQYVSACLNDIAKNAIVLLGQHGGYINLSRTDLHSQIFDIDETDQTAGDAVQFGALQIPYWWYENSQHSCTRCSITTKNIPTLKNMEEQITAYTQENLMLCLDNFASLEKQGYAITAAQEPRIETAIGDEAVYVQLTYPLEITKETSTSSLENWYVELNVPLQSIYNAANEIVTMEIRNQFLEQITLNITSAYSGLDEERLPPLAAFTEGYAVVYWMKQNVKEQLGKYLKTYISLIQIKGTTGAVELQPENKYGTGFFSMLSRESSHEFGTLEIDFIDPTTDFTEYYLDITPRTGELLKPKIYTNEFPVLLPPIQTNHYSFYYDVSYPVVVTLKDANALQGEGYTFFFALENNIRDNRNLMDWAQGLGSYGPWDASTVEIRLKEGVPTTYPSGIDTKTNETIYSTYEEPEKTLICSATQRLSGTVKVAAYNGITGAPIPSASIAFRCGTYKICSIGATDASGKYEGNFPVCIGGAVRIDADGYYTTFVGLDTTPEKEDKIIALLEQQKQVPVTIKFIPSSRANTSISSTALQNLAFDMDKTDSVLLTIEKVPDQLFEAPFSQVVSVSKQEPATITLVSGAYTVNALLLDQEGIIIPARNETISGKNIEYPEVNMTPAMLGQITLDATTGQWEVTSEDLQNAEGVTFYVWRANDPQYIEDLAQLGEFKDLTLMYRDAVEPLWEK